MNLKAVVGYLAARGKEPSTYRSIFALLGVAGFVFGPETVQAVSAAGIALAGLAGVFMPDAAPTPDKGA